MNAIWKHYREYIVGGLALIALFTFWYFAIEPLRLENQDILDEIQSAGVDVDIVGNETKRLSVLRAQSQMIRSHVDTFAVTASSDDPLHWVKELEQLAEETGNRIRIESDDAVTPKKASGVTGTIKAPIPKKSDTPTLSDELPSDQGVGIRIMLDGDYRSISLFMKKIELFHDYVDILSFKLTKNMIDIGGAQPESSAQAPVSNAPALQGSTAGLSTGTVGGNLPLRPMSAVFDSVVYTTK